MKQSGNIRRFFLKSAPNQSGAKICSAVAQSSVRSELRSKPVPMSCPQRKESVMSAKIWNSYCFSINGFPVQARFAREDIHSLFAPLLRRLTLLQKEKGARLTVFLAAPPAAGKSTLAAYLSLLSRELPDCLPLQALGLDGFHFHQDYILTHTVQQKDGHTLPMKQVKGSPETYDLAHFAEMLAALGQGNPLWPIYDRRLHDVVEEQLPVTDSIVLIEGNWLLLRENGWAELSHSADFTLFLRAEESLLRERLLCRKMQGGLSREEAEAFYQTGDGVNIRRCLEESGPADLTFDLQEDGSFSCAESPASAP